MAQKGVQLDRESFSCSICLDLLKDPVTTRCGHSYCMDCIKAHWDGEDEKRIYSCPQCEQTFTSRPDLLKNTKLADLVEEKKTGLQASPADLCYAGPEDVACDDCTGRKRKAVKSCLQCPASYCEKHLQHHYDVAPLKKHKLVEPSKKLQENICPHHNEVMKMFCRTDQQCICYLCSVEEHKGHDTVSAAAERTERQRELEDNIQQRIQDREKDVKLLQQEVEDINRSADKTVKHNEKMLTKLIRLLKKRRSDVKQQVKSKQETEVSRAKELQEKLQQEITELKRKDAELEQLSHTEDHSQFLHNYPSLSTLSESTDSLDVRPVRHFEDVTAAVTEVRNKLKDVLSEEWTKVSLKVTQVDVLLLQPEPKTRAEFLKYSHILTLDPNTAYKRLLLSEGNRKATHTGKEQSYSHHRDRFTHQQQVLSRESLTGRCYLEVKRRGRGEGVHVAVAYRNITRAGGLREFRFGHNDKSWALDCDNNLWYNKVKTPIPDPQSPRVGEYLDHSADPQSPREGEYLDHSADPQSPREGEYLDHSADPQSPREGEYLDHSAEPQSSRVRVYLDHSAIPQSPRVGEYLDHSAGPLSPREGEYLDHSADPQSPREGMYLDHSAGPLSPREGEYLDHSADPQSPREGEYLDHSAVPQSPREGEYLDHSADPQSPREGEYLDHSADPQSPREGEYLDHSADPQSPREGEYLDHSAGPQSPREGMYLDHRAGLLCFYSVSAETMTLLHRVQTTFTQPLHAGFFLHCDEATAELCKVELSDVI